MNCQRGQSETKLIDLKVQMQQWGERSSGRCSGGVGTVPAPNGTKEKVRSERTQIAV